MVGRDYIHESSNLYRTQNLFLLCKLFNILNIWVNVQRKKKLFPKITIVMLKNLVIKRSVVIFGGYFSLISDINSEMYSFLTIISEVRWVDI